MNMIKHSDLKPHSDIQIKAYRERRKRKDAVCNTSPSKGNVFAVYIVYTCSGSEGSVICSYFATRQLVV